MWIVELSFTAGQERLAARPAHRDRLASLHGNRIVRMAGPFADDSGALIVFDVADRATLDALIADDPYFRNSGVSITRVAEWRPFLG